MNFLKQARAGIKDAHQRVFKPVLAQQFEAPTSNTGRPEKAKGSKLTTALVMVNGKIKEIPIKAGSGTAAHIDSFTITMPESVFNINDINISDDELVCSISSNLQEIMGFGLFQKANGRNGYLYSYLMGNSKISYGYVAFGGSQQKDTVCIHFTGSGLLAAQNGWEQRLFDFIKNYAPTAKITRCDLAHDFFNGEYTPDQALQDWENGLFTARHTKPVAECVGSDWLTNTGKGKTFYIGSRKSSKYCRVYEKGKELGDLDSRWVRFELELKCKDIVIPHDILLNPGHYLTGAYPICQELFLKNDKQIAKPELKKKLQTVGIEHCNKYASIQVSGFLNFLYLHMGLSKEEIFDFVVNPNADMPKRLDPSAFDSNNRTVAFIHEFKRMPYSQTELIERIGEEFKSKKSNFKHKTFDNFIHEQNLRKETEEREFWQFAHKYLTPREILNPNFERKHHEGIFKKS